MTDPETGSLDAVALEALPVAAAVVGADGTLVAANERWRERAAAGAAGHPPVGEEVPVEDHPELASVIGDLFSGERDAVETRLAGTGRVVRAAAFEREGDRLAVVTTGEAVDDWPTGAPGVLDAVGDPVVVYDAAAGRLHVNAAAADLAGLERRSLPADGPAVDRIARRASEESVERLRAAARAVLSGEADSRHVELEVAPPEGPPLVLDALVTPLSGGPGVAVVGRDVTEYRQELRELAQLRDARETLSRVTAVVQDVIAGLVGESTREDIEAAAVRELARSELYRFAVVARQQPAGEELLGQSAAGLDDATARELGRTLLAAHESLLRTGEVRVVGLADHDLPASVGAEAVVVPLTYGSAVYGLLVVGLGRAGLTDRELSAFEVLGEVVGFAISAAKHRRLALADAVTELEFAADAGLLAALSTAAGADLRVESVVPHEEGTQLQYLAVEGAEPDAVAALARDRDGVERVRHLPDAPGGAALELAVTGGSVPVALAEAGATVEAASASGGAATVTAVVAADENVRGVVERVRTVVPGVELVRKRDVDRAPEPAGVPEDAVETLTERQRAALETAYRAGYFEHPRTSTAEEVADALDIASPTLHQHLQAAHRKLLDGVFGEET